jgi:ABC-2 type transport system permease protein
MMFLNILKFEIKYWFKNWSFYAYTFVIFIISFSSMAGASGAFGEGSSNAENIANSPLSILNFVIFFNKLLLFLIPAIVGATIFKDYKSNIHSIIYTYPFTKYQYLSAKFLSSFIIVCLIALSLELGLVFGTMLSDANPTQLVHFSIIPYLQTYFLYLVPNLFLFSTIVFTITVVSRNIYTGFIAIIIIWLVKEILLRFNFGNTHIHLIIDPFAETVINFYTRYWTITEKNSMASPIQPEFFYNRVFWLLIASLNMLLLVRWFTFSPNAISFSRKKAQNKPKIQHTFGGMINSKLPRTNFDFSFFASLKTSWKLSSIDFNFIIKSGAFISIIITGTIFIGALLFQINPQTETKTLPLTWVILGFPVFFYSFLIQILTFLYAGILVHQAKNVRFYDLVAVTPVSNWVLLFSKFLALLKMQLFLLFFIMITGIGVQLSGGHHQFEINHYLFDLLAIHLIGFVTWSFLSLLVHSLISNTYLGLFLLILFTLGISQFPTLGIENFVFRFNESPNADFYLKYSDINGYGHSLTAFLIFKYYWFTFGLFLFCMTILFWQREINFSFKERLLLAQKRLRGHLAILTAIIFALFLGFGFCLYKKENKPENQVLSPKQENALLRQFQNEYGKYKRLKQPRITSVFVALDIYPEFHYFQASGKYTLVNKTNLPIDTLLIKSGYDEITNIFFDSKAILISENKPFKFSVFKLEKSILPNDSIILNFSIKNKKNSFLVQNSNILKNGTYLKSDIFPHLGYFANTEKRNPNDTTALENHYQSIDADLVHFEAILSTSIKQTAITAGYLQKEWIEKDRRYFHYKMDKPIKFVIGFNSGEYEIIQEKYKGVDIGIYYHPSHKYNLIQLMSGLRASLDYNTDNFGLYQHTQSQIIEFPRSFGTYATTSANCIQMSEIRFVNDTSRIRTGGIDLSFYVAAHELSHQWWGNQVIPANVLGASMITESVAEYVTAKVSEKKYGKKSVLKFLEIQRNRYLSGKANDTGKEAALYLVDTEQSYISYGKGAIALYTFSEYIGEEKLNRALKAYLNKVKFQNPPYTTTLEMLGFLKKETPKNLQYLITDLFETTSSEKLFFHFEKIKKRNNASF